MSGFTLAQALEDEVLAFSADMRMLSIGRIEIHATAWGEQLARIAYNVEERSFACYRPFTGEELPSAFSESLLLLLPDKIKAQCAAASIAAPHR